MLSKRIFSFIILLFLCIYFFLRFEPIALTSHHNDHWVVSDSTPKITMTIYKGTSNGHISQTVHLRLEGVHVKLKSISDCWLKAISDLPESKMADKKLADISEKMPLMLKKDICSLGCIVVLIAVHCIYHIRIVENFHKYINVSRFRLLICYWFSSHFEKQCLDINNNISEKPTKINIANALDLFEEILDQPQDDPASFSGPH